MARRRRKPGLEKLLKSLAQLPWPVCLVLAVAAYFGFGILAARPVPDSTNLTNMGEMLIGEWLHVAGAVGQLLAPILLCIAAIMSFVAQRHRSGLLRKSQSTSGDTTINAMRWQDFEQVVFAWLETKNYSVTETATGADGGVDLIAKRDGEITLVQCKHWRATKVGVSVVRELYGLIAAQNATHGIVVSIGEFTETAHEFASGRNIELIDMRRLLREQGNKPHTPEPGPELNLEASNSQATRCPHCGSPMVRRVAKKGLNAGNEFFGCRRFPSCRGTREIK